MSDSQLHHEMQAARVAAMKGKNNTMLILLGIFLGGPILLCSGCLVLGIIGGGLNPPAVPVKDENVSQPEIAPIVASTPAELPADTNGVVITSDEYSRLTTGMTYADVVSVIGSDGEEVSSSDVGDIRTVMYVWKNSDFTNANAMFQNGKLVQKAQFGLK